MPLPLIIGGIAAVAGIAGVGSGIHGGIKMKEANDTMNAAKRKQENVLYYNFNRNWLVYSSCYFGIINLFQLRQE